MISDAWGREGWNRIRVYITAQAVKLRQSDVGGGSVKQRQSRSVVTGQRVS